jgi:hypothetical protein
MQRTRLNLLLNTGISKINNFFTNPWRKVSLVLISFLVGFFMASFFTTTVGQLARLDVTFGFLSLIFTEIVSIIVYRGGNNKEQSLGLNILNSFKIGFVYGLFLEAFKLAS